jgi:integrase
MENKKGRPAVAKEPELLGFLALAAFGGFRTESEVARMTRAQVIEALSRDLIAPPVVNKTRMRRVVPILPCLRAWLDVWIPLGVEPVPINFGRRWRRMKAEAGLSPWPQNVLRHSRVSYRLAQTGDEVLTAAEDGHSAQMLHQHYRALVTAADAERYFGILPTPGLDLSALARAERERQDATRQAGLRRPNRLENFPSDSTGKT